MVHDLLLLKTEETSTQNAKREREKPSSFAQVLVIVRCKIIGILCAVFSYWTLFG